MESIREQIAYGRRCKHGTPVGTPGGADLMCGPCEMGTTDAEYAALCRFEERLHTLRARRLRLFDLVDKTPLDGNVAIIQRINACLKKIRLELRAKGALM